MFKIRATKLNRRQHLMRMLAVAEKGRWRTGAGSLFLLLAVTIK